MLFDDRESVMSQEKPSFTVRCDEEFRAWLGRKAVATGLDVSKLTRAALILAMPQIETLRGLDRVDLEDIRPLNPDQ